MLALVEATSDFSEANCSVEELRETVLMVAACACLELKYSWNVIEALAIRSAAPKFARIKQGAAHLGLHRKWYSKKLISVLGVAIPEPQTEKQSAMKAMAAAILADYDLETIQRAVMQGALDCYKTPEVAASVLGMGRSTFYTYLRTGALKRD